MGSSNSTSCYSRQALHAGSWYSADTKELGDSLEGFLQQVVEAEHGRTNSRRLRALICPHAGYRYSGATAAYAYQKLRQEISSPDCPITTILVLHPAHHVYLPGCAVSMASELITPLGNLTVDIKLRREILQNYPDFSKMSKKVDESEHSGEMQYPYLAQIVDRNRVAVLPVMCGALSVEQEKKFGTFLSSIVARPNILTICSSDFCHWGGRFRFQPTSDDDNIPIHRYIESLDRRGMDLIQLQKPGGFAEYLKETNNSICGRHAIAVWMRAIEAVPERKLSVAFAKYDQSNPVESPRESSVSYAAATAYAE